MGMLHEIVEILSNINKNHNADISKLKRQVIENSIYGVDIESNAVDIARLRFWLSIVVDANAPEPLPNFDYKIMVGNSLLETINGFDPIQDRRSSIVREIEVLIKSYFSCDSNEYKAQIKSDINNLLYKILDKKFIEEENSYSKIFNTDFIDGNRNIKSDRSLKKEEKTRNLMYLKYNLLNKILKDFKANDYTSVEIFFYKLWFADVMDNGGFDVVIGNPPYVRQKKIKDLKAKEEIQGFKSFCGTADLYIYFFEKGFNLLKENGILSYITSNKYTREKYGAKFREFVLKNTTIMEYVDFNGVKVFKSATVDTSIMTYKKSTDISESIFKYCSVNSTYKKNSELLTFIDKNGFEYAQNDLNIDSFSFLNSKELAIKKQIEKIGTPLKDWDIKINRGILTGFTKLL